MAYHKTHKRWDVDLDAIRDINAIYTAVRRGNPKKTADEFLLPSEGREDHEDGEVTEVAELREPPEYIEEADEDLYAVEEYDES